MITNKISSMLAEGAAIAILTIPAAMAQPPTFTSLHDGEVVTNPFPTITGTATPYADMNISKDTTAPYNTQADASGKWTASNMFLPNGQVTLTAVSRMLGGTDVTEKSTVTFTVNAPTVVKPFVVEGLTNTINGFVYQNDPTFYGTGTAGAIVTLEDAGAAKTYASHAIAADGQFRIAPSNSTRLPEGSVTVRVKQSTGESKDIPLVVNTSLAKIASPAEGATLNDNSQITVTGTSAPYLTFRILEQGGRLQIGSATADATGRWYATFMRPDIIRGKKGPTYLEAVDQFYRSTGINIIWN
ncbi:hypothetical protein GN109_08780 [Collimonas pratensis]|uniref:hypothetical protein n=1 Tax=Collimonas pratensis TaxID=279113 RepID=UPI00143D731A|nr:hypothetical protein [Collimonas pratensis]NKI69511.1 hypothetical protein [Collimonas pratensis]